MERVLFLSPVAEWNTYIIDIFFRTSQISQKRGDRVEILGTLMKDTKVRLYDTNFLKFQKKKIFEIFFSIRESWNVVNLNKSIKVTKVRLYGTNFSKFQKKNVWKFFF